MGTLANIGSAIAGGGLMGSSYLRKKAGNFLFGEKAKDYQQSLLGKEQQPLYQQLLQAGQGQGAGGAFGQSADYFRDLLSDNPEDMQAFGAPEMRQFNEQTIPGLAEQFAGMGSGGLSSSGFRNAAVGAGADLGERLGSIRANLRQQGAQGLQGIGQAGLGTYNENIHMPARPGFFQGMAPGAGQAATMYAGSRFGGSGFGQSSPYGNNQMGGR